MSARDEGAAPGYAGRMRDAREASGRSGNLAPGNLAPGSPAHRRLNRLDTLAYWLDEAFPVPGTNWRIGFDGILGLLFGVGDTATFLAGGYALWVGIQLDAPKPLLARMLGNLLVDYFVGLIPLVGDFFDFRIKAHRKNARLLRTWLEREGANA